MARVVEDIRKLTVTGKTTYYVTIPQSMVKELKWKKGEKKVIKLKGKEIVIKDWVPK